uniref:granulocyte colony-stimulating factor receptor n=1 Tax=Centroberyx gerrardi TaxID=166262 RepID=UPI003AAABF6E
MTSTWVSVIAMLLAFVNGARNEDDTLPCAKVQTSGSVVVLGSPVTATCVIRDDCPLASGQAVHIEWHLGQRLLPSSPAANDSSRISRVVIPSFNDTRAYLTCCIQATVCQIVGGVEIRAGYPPPVPQNLRCQTNLTSPSTLSCSWEPGQDTQLLTKYTLHTEIWDSYMNHTYELPTGVYRYTIPRTGFVLFSDMEICVKAVNELGEASSLPIILEPLGSAKFDPPEILKVQVEPKRHGCLRLSWSLSQHQAWVPVSHLNLQVRLKSAGSSQWSEQPIQVTRVNTKTTVCRLLHGKEYYAQIRVRYQQSPWSEWSSSQSGVTLETAPTGRLDSWMKVSGELKQKHLTIHLFWKPSKQFRANGRNVSYVVSLQRPPGEKGQVCSTLGHYCTFQLPKGAKKVFLRSVNAAGKSSPTEVPVHLYKAGTPLSDITALSRDDRSLLVQWTSLVSSGLTGYIVEWRPLLQTDPSLIHFDITNRSQSSLVITGFEPYKPYGISVYPRYKDGIGRPQTVNAYSRQKAPTMVPNLRFKETWHSYIELTWDEISLDQRNGIVRSYKVFYWDEQEHIKVVNADLEKRKVVLKELNTVSSYKAFMMVSTDGGSLNGSTIDFKTEPIDAVTVVLIVIPSSVGLSLLIIITVLICFSTHKRLKVRFWPMIPDPANSSIKRWTSETIQDTPSLSDVREPNPVYLSHLSFLDIPTKLDKGGDDPWLHSGVEDTSDLGESICGSPLTPGYSGSNSESVPYATVIFSGPYMSQSSQSSQSAGQSHVYLRSESTQPLLESEDGFSPKSYQNMPADAMTREQCFFGPCEDVDPGEKRDSGVLWDDFPLLRALAMNDAQSD